jgi:hypothetical protein
MVAGMLVSEPGAMDEMMKDVPIRRLGHPEEIAAAGWLKTHLPNEVPASADDAMVITFLKTRLQQ